MPRKTLFPLIFAILSISPVWSEELEEPAVIVEEPVALDEPVRVTVLGYHDFSASQEATEMRLPIPKFRKQLQEIKDNNLNVISLEEFIAWKKGEETVPDRSVLITIDDGWKSVYTDAFPVFKEFNFPFTVYLYKNYVDGGGRALTTKMIQEMQDSGLCTIGSHSVSHPFPSKVKSEKRKGEQPFTTFLEAEFGDSKNFLEHKFLQKVTTYAYPGGFHVDEMFPIADKFEYDFLFTVIPGKVKKDSPDNLLNRYIILGTHDYIFKNAIRFKNLSPDALDSEQLKISTAHPVFPVAGSSINDRTPEISVDLSAVALLDPDSIVMRIAGFGKVPITYDADTKKVSWQVNRPIHAQSVEVVTTWKVEEGAKAEPPLKWIFLVDRAAAYLPSNTPSTPDKAE